MSLFRKKNAKAQDADRYKNMFNTPCLTSGTIRPPRARACKK